MASGLFGTDFRPEPYWWDTVPRPDSGDTLPASTDVLVVGSGYTGLSAALVTARAGRSTVVVDAEAAGFGCSTRNGGQISTSIKPGFEALAAAHGPEHAWRILREGHDALAWIGHFVAEERIDCDFTVCGRFHAAHTPGRYREMEAMVAAELPGLETGARLVPRTGQHSEIGTDAYHGGVVYPRHACVDPARLHQGLLERARAAGARVVTHCPVNTITRQRDGFEVLAGGERVRAGEVVLATNGYTGPLSPWQRRRVIPIGSYIIATEEIDPALMDRLMPRGRIVSDSRRVVYYYRASPDRRRILFGGRVSFDETDPRRSAPRLHAEMVRLFPELAGARISHAWAGFVAYTFDTLPHLGRHDGIHYAMGYCGSGVSMAPYLGMRLGQQVLGMDQGGTAFDSVPFRTRPLYTGKPWFLAASVAWYRWLDRLDR